MKAETTVARYFVISLDEILVGEQAILRNIVVLPGDISINPINWKRDESYVSAEESLGGYIFNEETGLPEDYPHAADAKIDLKRGVVITTTKAVAPKTFPLFGPGSFHENDYPLYYYNFKANVAKRVAAYKKGEK